MTFRALHGSLAGASCPISRKHIKAEVLRLSGAPGVRIVASGLNLAECRGLYLSPNNTEHPLAKQLGGHIVVVGRGLNYCWTRFIVVKELMHMLDGAVDATDNGDKFDTLLKDLQPNATERSAAGKAEILAFWKALAVLCPEQHRAQYKVELSVGRMKPFDVAQKLMIPEHYISNLFEARFESNMRRAYEE